jgi:hypothetical protein
MSPEQRDIILAGCAVRGWPHPRRFDRPWEKATSIVWTWPAHRTCPAMYRNEETGEIQEMHVAVMVHDRIDTDYLCHWFASMDDWCERIMLIRLTPTATIPIFRASD